MLIHLGGLQNLSLQELNDFLDVTLAHEISDQVKNLLIDLKGDDSIILNDSKDVVDVVLEDLEVVFAQLQDLVENDHLHVVVIVLLQQIQIALNCHFNGTGSCSELCDRVSALEENGRTL